MTTTADHVPLFGPKMLVLSEKWRAFVMALYHEDAPLKGDGLLIYAARAAGYGTPTSTNKSLGVIATRIAHDERVQEAIAEYSKQRARAISPEALRAVRDAIRDPKSRDHIRAAAMILDRTVPVETTHTVRVEDYRAPPREVTEKVIAHIVELARKAGMPALPPPVDAEFQVISEAGR